MKKILIQSAMDVEISYFLKKFDISDEKEINGYKFYICKKKDCELFFSKTGIGVINATIATMIGINEFEPDIVINQGLAGAHSEELNIGDIVVGKECININSLEMPSRDYGQGSNSLEWKFKNRKNYVQKSDEKLYSIVKQIPYTCGKIFYGILGSGDVFNREKDRIKYIVEKQNTLSEDMESIGTYATCKIYKIPCIGIRIISNNELKNPEGLDVDMNVGENLQKYICEYLKELV